MKFASRISEKLVALIVPKPGRRPRIFARVVLRTSGAPRAWLGARWQARIRHRLLVNWLVEVQGIPVSDGRVAMEALPSGSIEKCAGATIIRDAAPGVMLLMEPDASIIAGGAARLVKSLAASDDAVVAYGDALYADADGRVFDHWLKPPRMDPLLVARGLLLHGLVAVREDAPGTAALCNALREGAEFRQALSDFASGMAERSCVHCDAPVVLCTPPTPLPAAPPSLPDPLPVASILIPTRNSWDLLSACLASLRDTDWPPDRLEIVVIDNGSDDPETCRQLEARAATGEITLLHDNGDFNFARLNNAAAKAARADLLVLLNNDTVALDGKWLKRLAAYALQPAIGAVGCKLLYSDGDVQHAGMVCGIRGGAQHVFVGIDADAPGYNHLAVVDRSVSVVTAACLVVRRDAFDRVGGLRKDFAVSYNDVVFCLDLMAEGYRNVCVGTPLFVHGESRSRGRDTDTAKRRRHRGERAGAFALHPKVFAQDPFYSVHLSRKDDHALLPDRLAANNAWRARPDTNTDQ